MNSSTSPSVAVIRPYASLPSEGGSNDRYINLCEKLLALGARPRLFCSDFIHNEKRQRSREAVALNQASLPYLRQIRSIPYRNNVSLARVAHEALFGVKVFWDMLREPTPDVVVVGEPLFLVGWIALFYGQIRGVPVICDLIDLWPEADVAERHGIAGALRKLAYRALIFSRTMRIGCYRSASFVSRSYAERVTPNRSAAVFYWGSQLAPRGRAAGRAPSGGPVTAIYAGSLGDGYDIGALIEAASILHKERQGVRIVVAGDGPRRADITAAANDGLIEYRGLLNREQLIEAYEQAEIGLAPYSAGSMVAMPIKFFDYVNFGLYVVSSLALEAREVIEKHEIGISYAAGDARDLANKLAEVARSRGALERARANCAELSRDFSVDTQYLGFARFVVGQATDARASDRISGIDIS
jgi:glycosyltransferase involved in cell wall biosynthesis